jgi:hypothetical protein
MKTALIFFGSFFHQGKKEHTNFIDWKRTKELLFREFYSASHIRFKVFLNIILQ